MGLTSSKVYTNELNTSSFVNDSLWDSYYTLQTSPAVVIDLILLILVSIVGIFGNILIIVCILFHKKLKNVTSLFVANLAMADLFLSAIVAPGSIKILWLKTETQTSFWCNIYGFFVFFPCAAVVNFSSLIALTRYIVICKSHWVGRVFQRPLTILWCSSLWLCTFLQTLVPSLTTLFVYKFNPVMGVCHLDYTRHPIIIGLYINGVCFAPCVILCLVCYFLIFKILRETRKNLTRHMTANSAFLARKLARERRATLPLFISLIAFFVHWLPIMVAAGLDPNFEKYHSNVHRYLGVFSIASACDNWIIYGLLNKNFAVGYRIILCYWKRLWPGITPVPGNGNPTEAASVRNNDNSNGGLINDRRHSANHTGFRGSLSRRLTGLGMSIPLVSEEEFGDIDSSDSDSMIDKECYVTVNHSAVHLLAMLNETSMSDSLELLPLPYANTTSTTTNEISVDNDMSLQTETD